MIRSPKASFKRTLQGPESNFNSYLQVVGSANLLNYLGAGLHLRLEMSILSLFGVAVSMGPAYTAVDKEKIGLNFYLGGGFTLHGANQFIGFREGLIGAKLRLGSANSKIDPGVCSIEVQGSLQGIPLSIVKIKIRLKQSKHCVLAGNWELTAGAFILWPCFIVSIKFLTPTFPLH